MLTKQIPVWGTIFTLDSQFPPSDQSNLVIYLTSLEGHTYHCAWAAVDVQCLHPTVPGRQNMRLPQVLWESGAKVWDSPGLRCFRLVQCFIFLLHARWFWDFLGNTELKKDAKKSPAHSSRTRIALSNVFHWFSSFFPVPCHKQWCCTWLLAHNFFFKFKCYPNA